MIPLILFLLALRLFLSIPVVGAYALHYTFRIPHVPFELGRRHIHAPEHLATVHRLSLPRLRLVETHPPRRVENYTVVSFEYATLLGAGRATMFASDPSVSHVFLADARRAPLFLARLAVAPDPENPHGHIVRAQGEFLRPPTWLERTLAPAFLNVHGLENGCVFGYQVPAEDPNLRAYRLAVLHGRLE